MLWQTQGTDGVDCAEGVPMPATAGGHREKGWGGYRPVSSHRPQVRGIQGVAKTATIFSVSSKLFLQNLTLQL
jgi:hypothetical protein